jgi:hypothetical protein
MRAKNHIPSYENFDGTKSKKILLKPFNTPCGALT